MKQRLNLEEIRIQIKPVLEQYGVVNASIFGSYARGEANDKSDLDLLVEFKLGRTLFDQIDLQLELEEKLGIKADLATKLNRHFQPYIEPDLIKV